MLIKLACSVCSVCVYNCSTNYKAVRVWGGGIVKDTCYESLVLLVKLASIHELVTLHAPQTIVVMSGAFIFCLLRKHIITEKF